MLEMLQDYIGWGFNGLTDFIIPFLIVLSVLVFVHEWGHYYVARLCGVRVEKFSIGFGRELFGFTDKAGTRWKFSLIPLGGYVQMFGDQDPASATQSDEIGEGDEKRPMTAEEKRVAFFNKPVWQRAAVVFAGPAINFLFAIVILTALYISYGKPVTAPVASAVIVGGAAHEAGIQPHDRIIAIDGQAIQSFNDIQRQVAISLDRPLDLTILRDGEITNIIVTPRLEEMEDRFGFKHSRGMMGIMGGNKGIELDSIQKIQKIDVAELDQDKTYDILKKNFDKDILITLPSGDDSTQELLVHPVRGVNQDALEEEGQLVLASRVEQERISYSALQAVQGAFKETGFIISGTLEALGQIITGTRSARELGGIVRIGAIAGDAAQAGFIALITFTALLSINLGLINLFPVPLLDGGHLVFYAYEAVFGKPMPDKVMDYALRAGMVMLIGLMVFANLNDIVQLIL